MSDWQDDKTSKIDLENRYQLFAIRIGLKNFFHERWIGITEWQYLINLKIIQKKTKTKLLGKISRRINPTKHLIFRKSRNEKVHSKNSNKKKDRFAIDIDRATKKLDELIKKGQFGAEKPER